MSKWLQNVGNFLEKLDDQAERVVEERIELYETADDAQLASILQARGLEDAADDDAERGEGWESATDLMVGESEHDENDQQAVEQSAMSNVRSATRVPDTPEASAPDSGDVYDIEKVNQSSEMAETSPVLVDEEQTAAPTASSQLDASPSPASAPTPPPPASEETSKPPTPPAPSSTPFFTPRAALASVTSQRRQSEMTPASASSSSASVRQSQQETRTLRRHVVALNQKLELAESEMDAQRAELERAAERLEKDRVRHRTEREAEKKRQAEELAALKMRHEQEIQEIRERAEAQVEEVRRQMKLLEDRRMQEGGDMNKELADAIHREQEAIVRLVALEDEKATLLSQITTLQSQQEALGSRLESLSQTTDNAMERERDAENRLDEALSAHARQIAQRQAREAELERTVAELGAALVAERNKKTDRMSMADPDGSTASLLQDSASSMRVATLESEVETLRSQLALEEQRSFALQKELNDLAKERSEESTVLQTRQQHYDRRMSDMSTTIAQLKTELQQTKRESLLENGRGADDEDAKQIKNLSEEVLRQREKLSASSSEIAALKSRLQVAMERIKRTEAALEEERASNGESGVSDVEIPIGNGMRRRGVRRPKARQPSIRQALRLDSLQDERTEKLGRSLDALDAFLTESGKFLRYNPVARLFFITYLLLLHLWTFALLFFHAHGFETVHGDFGAGGVPPHGPGALMQQLEGQAPPAVAASAGIDANGKLS